MPLKLARFTLLLGCSYYNRKVKQTACNAFQTKKTQTQKTAMKATWVNKDYVGFTIATNTPFIHGRCHNYQLPGEITHENL
jgi:hypothetical protein